LDTCEFLNEIEGCRSFEFTRGDNCDTVDTQSNCELLSNAGTFSPEPAVTPEEGAEPTLPLEPTIDR
jgi:hypothetical protein